MPRNGRLNMIRTISVNKMAAALAALTVIATASNAATDYISPIVLATDKDGKMLYVAEATAKQVAIIDIASGKVTTTVKVSGEPGGLALSPDGSTLYVSIASPEGTVDFVTLPKGKVARSVTVGHTAVSPVPSPDGKFLYVCNQYNNSVSVINLESRKETARIPVIREPFAATITPDGKFLFVANLLPGGAADVDYVGAVVSVIDTAAGKATAAITLPNGSTSLRGICISPDGKHIYVTHTLSRYQLPTTQLERGWMNTSAISIIDVAGKKLINSVLLDDVDLGAANPWGVACTADGKTICVAHAGTQEISLINRDELHAKLDKAEKGEKVSDASSTASDVPNDLSFLVGLRKRIKLQGNGPRGIAVAGMKVYAAEYFTDTIGVVDSSPDAKPGTQTIELGKKKELTLVRKGEMIFNDGAACFQQWQSCATCHPDARVDALNWDLLNDGIGNPKQTKNMLLAHKTGPTMITGIREDAELAVRKGLQFIQFVVRPEEDAVAIDEYLKSLKPIPSPYLVDGKLSKAAKRGKKLFEKAACASCHPDPLFTDMNKYNVGTGIGSEKDKEFDTPTLVEIWRTAPYLYDGRAATMEEVLTKFNKNDLHGKTSKLTPEEIKDLVEYILSL